MTTLITNAQSIPNHARTGADNARLVQAWDTDGNRYVYATDLTDDEGDALADRVKVRGAISEGFWTLTDRVA